MNKTYLKIKNNQVVNRVGDVVFTGDRKSCELFIKQQQLRSEAVKSAAKYFTSTGPMDVSDKD